VPPDLLANIVAPLVGKVPLSQPTEQGPADVSHTRVAADVSRRHLQCGENAPTDVGGYAQLANPARGDGSGSGGEDCGLVCCFYRLANPTTLAMQWEAIAINADFWSQVLQSGSLKPIDFALGAVMATRRRQLEEIGGFATLVDCLADDNQLGNRIARRGYSIAVSPVVVECWSAPMGWAAVWKHQLRWARTIRVCQPAPYFFSLLSNATLWPLLWLIVRPAAPVVACALVCFLVRILTALDLQQRLTRSRPPYARGWLVPIKDLLQAAIWLLAFMGNRIEWRGERMRLRRDGTLVRG
jgi:ceramide glucosyltransferase